MVVPTLQKAGRAINIERRAFIACPADIEIGDRSGIGVRCRIEGPATLGRDVMMGPDVLIAPQNHATQDTTKPMFSQGYRAPSRVYIEDDVWIGARAIILPGVAIGKGAIVGAGAVVPRDVPAFSVVVGNPASVVRDRRYGADPTRM